MLAKIKPLRAKGLLLAEKLGWLAPLLLRLTVGVVFVQSGWGKLHNLEQVTGFFRELGIPMAEVQAPFIAALELVGGVALLLGLLTRVFSALLASTMAVAILTAIWPKLETKKELFDSIEWHYLVMCLALVVLGAGSASVDGVIATRVFGDGEGAAPAPKPQ